MPCLQMLFLENEEQPSEKKLQSTVSQVKRNPHGKIQLFLSTFKNSQKTMGTFLPAAFQLVGSLAQKVT